MELKRNSSKMSLRPRGETWEWYTARTPIASIHIHNQAGGGWGYEICSLSTLKSRGFDTKEEAYGAAVKRLRAALEAVMKELEVI